MPRRQCRRRLGVHAVLPCSSCVLVTFVIVSSGCVHSRPRPTLGTIYSEAARGPDYLRNPVIVIPGVLGSRLVNDENGEVVWGRFERASLIRRKNGDITSSIALPMREGASLAELRDLVRSDGTLAYLEIDVPGRPIEIQAYGHILASLDVGGFRDPQYAKANEIDYGDEHFTCFQFDYDWRRDVAENAARLDEFINDRREYIRREYERRYGIKNSDIRFDIVAHSMGGLVARYYLRYGAQPLPDDGTLPELNWAGAKKAARIVLVGTPNAGSALVVRDLVRGHRLAPMLPKYPPAVLGTMPAIYQLLPRPRHGALVDAEDENRRLDVYDPALWRDMNWGLANPEQDSVLQQLLPDIEDSNDRRRIALEHQRKCLLRARQLHQALDVPAAPPPSVTLHLFAGDAIKTPSVVGVNEQTGDIETKHFAAGDDTTTRASAIMDERIGSSVASRLVSPIRWTSTMFLHTSHRSQISDPIFTDNVLALLLESPQPPSSLSISQQSKLRSPVQGC